MKTLKTFSIACGFTGLLALSGADASLAQNLEGVWKTSYGYMTLDQRGDQVVGTYDSDGGKVEGRVHFGQFIGYWAEKSSAQKCGEVRLGTVHWGRLEWRMSDDGNSFKGLWSYCEAEPTGVWDGARESGPSGPGGGEGHDSGPGQGFDTSGWHVPDGAPAVSYDNSNPNACDHTDTATFTVNQPIFLARIEVWMDWSVVGTQSTPYSVAANGRPIGGGVLQRGSCDPYQGQWCAGLDSPSVKVPPGTYTIRIGSAAICQNAGTGGNGMIKVYDP